MEHYRSTLATTAAAVFGLVAAAHILHPGNYEPRTRPVRAPVADAAAGPAWVDPPAALRGSAVAPARDVAASADVTGLSAVSGLLAPRTAIALAPGAAMAPPLPAEMAAVSERPRKAAPRARAAARAVRTRQAALQAPNANLQSAGEAAPARGADASRPASARIDPIGDLIRGLGLDG